MMVDTNAERRARQLLEERDKLRGMITIDEGGGACDIGSPVEDAPNVPTINSTRTLLTSYPGSGKRFTWTVVKALTNYEVADDWNFSEKLKKNPLTIKTSWPHKEGTWSWGKQMDQVLLLIRNPRRAIPSYHTMRWELDYARSWKESFLRIPDTYMERPTVEQWEIWRNSKFNREIEAWYRFYDFWMQAGYQEDRNETHNKCIYENTEIDCEPKALVDFENIYTDQPNVDFHKIGAVLDNLDDVEVIAEQARSCVLLNVFNRTNHHDLNMHQASRPDPDLPMEYKFTLNQLDRVFNRTIMLRDRYLEEPHSLKPLAGDLVSTLNRYLVQNTPEYFEAVDITLEEFALEEFGSENCTGVAEGTESYICNVLVNKENLLVFFDGYYPDDFPYLDWLRDRSILMRLYLNQGGEGWIHSDGWMQKDDHCLWYGVTCDAPKSRNEYNRFRISELFLQSNNLIGAFPIDLRNLELLERLEIDDNEMYGVDAPSDELRRLENDDGGVTIPDDLCKMSTTNDLYLSADAFNCQNTFDHEIGKYRTGCCDFALVDVPIYLNYFVETLLGATDANCNSLFGIDSQVCLYMQNPANHDVFVDGYPYEFSGNVYKWLRERAILTKFYLSNEGNNWFKNDGWLKSTNHCEWYGIECEWNMGRSINLENNNIVGTFPNEFIDIERFHTMKLGGNSMTSGIASNQLCSDSTSGKLNLHADAGNCPNDFDYETGTYLQGCCDNVLLDVDIYLLKFAEGILGDSNCDNLGGTASNLCSFITSKSNHDVFNDGFPYDFSGNLWKWLKERAIIVRFYLNNGGDSWNNNTGWLSSLNHCDWHDIQCEWNMIRYMDLENNNIIGSFPSDLGEIERFHTLKLAGNKMTGPIADQICEDSLSDRIVLHADSQNCHNNFDYGTGTFLPGCCDIIKISVEDYLQHFAAGVLGSSDCESLIGVETEVCTYMTNPINHDIFSDGYPLDFEGDVWRWIKERAILVKMFLDDSGDSWTTQDGWLREISHCDWYGISCNTFNEITGIDLEQNGLAGAFPDLGGLVNMTSLNVHDNALIGIIPSTLCTESISNGLSLMGDSFNCPNDFLTETGEYAAGCCDNILIDVDIYLNHFASAVFGDTTCDNLDSTDVDVCNFMSDKNNHAIFAHGYPVEFNGDVWEWIAERAILSRMYFNDGGVSWSVNTGWISSENHCLWFGISCNESNSITEIMLESNGLQGSFPLDLSSLHHLILLNVHDNSLIGELPDNLCTESKMDKMHIFGDSPNCPNDFLTDTGEYEAGCCDNILIDVDIYLNHLIFEVLGDTNCNNLAGTEVDLCNFIQNKHNHAIFENGYPSKFEGDIWQWIGERLVLVRMYLNDGGSSWSSQEGWLSTDNHCNWYGVTCSASFAVISIDMAGNQISGPFPTDLNDLTSLTQLNFGHNTITGIVPEDMCEKALSGSSALLISGDEWNCPNQFDSTIGEYATGCCNHVFMYAFKYLDYFASAMYGDSECENLDDDIDKTVCVFMKDESKHAIFDTGYPYDFDGDLWKYLTERSVLVELYTVNGGDTWNDNSGWLSTSNHCAWYGIVCTLNNIEDINLSNNHLGGDFLDKWQSIENLKALTLHGNSLIGSVPVDLCSLDISADHTNCPNTLVMETGVVSSGCCDTVVIVLEEYFKHFLNSIYGVTDCSDLTAGPEVEACNFMINPLNHDLFANGYPSNFGGDVWSWLQERSIVVEIYLENEGSTWSDKSFWLTGNDHCSWYGISCDDAQSVIGIDLENNQLAGQFPLHLASLSSLTTLHLGLNTLTGDTPHDICAISESSVLHISGDDRNCINEFNSTTGEYSDGCCDFIHTNVDTYLDYFSVYAFGDTSCGGLEGTEVGVCNFISEKTNTDIFASGFPYSFVGDVWSFLKERSTIVRMYLNAGGNAWTTKTNWMTSTSHCTWFGIACSVSNRITDINLENNAMFGDFPADLGQLDRLEALNMHYNSLVGDIPSDVCTESTSGDLRIYADEGNCPNDFQTSTGEYLPGCCDNVLIDVDIYLTNFAAAILGDSNCDNLSGIESSLCKFMSNKDNHAIFENGEYPYSFSGNVWEWIKERAILARMYLNDGGVDWVNKGDWFTNEDHCNWYGIECSDKSRVTDLLLESNRLIGPYPSDLGNLVNLIALNLHYNSLTGTVPNDICTASINNGLHLQGDASNCPNDFLITTGEYAAGCCDNILIDVDIYLNHFTSSILGGSDCNNLVGTEVDVCKFMKVKNNHAVFKSGYPHDFENDLWRWIKERAVLVRMYFNGGGTNWIDNLAWLSDDDHCSWSGISCDDNFAVTSINMEANQMTGPFPTDLNDLTSLVELKIGHNAITDTVPHVMCEKAALSISGDAWNCPNQFDSTIGEYATGCCDHVFKDVETYLDYFAFTMYGDSVCGNLDDDTDKSVCTFMKDESKHAIFANGFPDDFEGNTWVYMKERSILVRLFQSTNGIGWNDFTGWLETSNHCSWRGVQCSFTHNVQKLSLSNRGLIGAFPDYLSDLANLNTLRIGGNFLGNVADAICTKSESGGLYFLGDDSNCPNTILIRSGETSPGCCDVVHSKVYNYLSSFVDGYFGDKNCNDNLQTTTETDACSFILDPSNQDRWEHSSIEPNNEEDSIWLNERAVLASMYVSNNYGYNSWTQSGKWMTNQDQCYWHGITCTFSGTVMDVNLQGNGLTGPYPNNLEQLANLQRINLGLNSLVGSISTQLCDDPGLYIAGDSSNCQLNQENNSRRLQESDSNQDVEITMSPTMSPSISPTISPCCDEVLS